MPEEYEEYIVAMVEDAGWTSSGDGSKLWRFVGVTDRGKIGMLGHKSLSTPYFDPPSSPVSNAYAVVIVVCFGLDHLNGPFHISTASQSIFLMAH